MDKLEKLSTNKYTFTANQLIFNDFINFDEWSEVVNNLKMMKGSIHFWLGDALNFGEANFGEQFSQVLDALDYAQGTLSNDKWVASRIEPSRRREGISFAHYQVIADLTPEEQEEMLDLIVRDHLDRNEFRKVVRNFKLRLDLPEFSEEQLKGSSEDFDYITDIVMELVDVIEKLKKVEMESINPDARDFLLSQIKKSFGYMGGVLNKYEK